MLLLLGISLDGIIGFVPFSMLSLLLGDPKC
jgi:hypothetical protein